MRTTSCLNINLAALDRNVGVIRELIAPHCDLCAVVKADAYGMGAARIARQLAESGVSMLAVYNLAQAEAISLAGVTTPQLVLMPVREIELGGEIHRLLLAGRLHLVVHGESHARELAAISEQLGGGPIPVHLEIDTGMSRGGVIANEAGRTLALIADERRLRLVGIFTHFSDSRVDDVRTHTQMDAFEKLLADHAAHIPSDALIHVANSHAILRDSRFHRKMVRTGLAWTGLVESHSDDGWRLPLESIIQWESQIVHTKLLPCDVAVGYGSLWTTRRPTRLGIIPVGYFDGYPAGSAESDRRWIRVIADSPTSASSASRSWDVPVVGAVNMDQIMVDLTDVPPSIAYGDGHIGMTAELYGAQPSARNFLPRVAEAVGAHAYELLCRINPRIPRQYVGESTGTITADLMRIDRQSPGAMTG